MTDLILMNWRAYLIDANSNYFRDQLLFRFPNGFGASVIRGGISYGNESGLFELGVVFFDDDGEHHLTYQTPITDDVLGYLSSEQVEYYLQQVMLLPSKDTVLS